MPETKIVKGCKDCSFRKAWPHGYYCNLVRGGRHFYDGHDGVPPDWCPLRAGPVLVSLEDAAPVERPKPPNTVRVRILVAVDPTGYWDSAGWKGAGSDDLLKVVMEGVGIGERVSWIEADVPMPEEMAIEGVVVEGGEG